MAAKVCLLQMGAKLTQKCRKHVHASFRDANLLVDKKEARWVSRHKVRIISDINASRGKSGHPSPPCGVKASDHLSGWYRRMLDRLANDDPKAGDFFKEYRGVAAMMRIMSLQELRLSRDLTQEDVARFLRGGRSRQRVAQIESQENASADDIRDFRTAVEAAAALREKTRLCARRLAAELSSVVATG